MLALAWCWADLTVSATRAPEQQKRLAQMSPTRWREALHRLHQASALDPLNARYDAELGRHYAWLAWRSSRMPEASRSFRQRSREAFGAAVGARPSWGYAWVNYAESSLLAGIADDGTRLALDRAMTLAPWETRAQLKSLLVAFSLWDRLDENQRRLATETLRRALVVGDEVELIVRMAVHSGRENLVERWLVQESHRELLDRVMDQTGR